MALLGGVDYVCPINFMYPHIFHLVVDMAHVHQYNFSNLNEVASIILSVPISFHKHVTNVGGWGFGLMGVIIPS